MVSDKSIMWRGNDDYYFNVIIYYYTNYYNLGGHIYCRGNLF